MFKHLFILIWNKKKQNFLLLTEILVSFLVLFAVFSLLVYCYFNYQKPMGFNYDNVWVVNYNFPFNTENKDTIAQFEETVRQTVRSMPQVKGMSFSGNNVPFANNVNMGGTSYNKKPVNSVNWYRADDSYIETMQLQLLEGRWFNKADDISKYRPVVINRNLKEALFNKSNAIGELLGKPEDTKRPIVVGVVENTKFKGDYATPGYAIFNREDGILDRIMIKVTPDADAAFEGRLYKTLANTMHNANIEIEHLNEKRTSINYFAVVPMVALSIVSLFLIINVAMGLFGVLWYNINKRRGEIGLRRAIGATGNSVSGQLVAESMILATLSLIIGTFFAIQFPLLKVFDLPAAIYITALVIDILFIYFLVLLCSFYPGKQAAAIYPAVALHED